MATNVILEYKRGADEWQCPICDAENRMSQGNCAVCGGTKTADATILRRWTPTPVARPMATPPMGRAPEYSTGPVYRDKVGGPMMTPEKPKTGCVTGLMVVLIALIIILVLFLAMMANAEELCAVVAENLKVAGIQDAIGIDVSDSWNCFRV